MATLYISEFVTMGNASMAPLVPAIVEQHVQIGSSSVLSSPFNKNTKIVMVNCDTACCLAWGPASVSPVAVTTSQRMGANETRFYNVPPGYELAVIAATA